MKQQEKRTKVPDKKFVMKPMDNVIFWGCIEGKCKTLDHEQQARIIELYHFLDPSLKKKEKQVFTSVKKQTWFEHVVYFILLLLGTLAVLAYWSMR